MTGFVAIGWIIFAFQCRTAPPENRHDFLDKAGQLIVVISRDTDQVEGSLTKYEKHKGKWVLSGEALPVVLGRTGLAPGIGLHSPDGWTGNPKREGDGKSPAGFFHFGKAFGYAPAGQVPFRWPYLQATAAIECVDDGSHALYNQLVDTNETGRNWSSSETMMRSDDLYRWGIVVQHNTPAISMGGSCIFFHIWSGPGRATAGCTAMKASDLLPLLQWLDPDKEPVLVQLPREVYDQIRRKFGLPGIDP